MKKIIAMIVVLMMLVSLAIGCSKTDSDQSEGNSDQSEGSVEKKETSEEKNKKTQKTITMATFKVREKDLVDTAMAEFMEQNSDIKVEVQYITNEQYMNVIKMKFAANEAPDVFSVWNIPEFVKADYLMDISDFDAVSKQIKGVDIYKFDGKVYALGMGMANLGMLANNTVLKESGVTSLPKNFKELLVASEKIKASGFTPIAYGDKDGTSSELHGGWAAETLMTVEEGKGIPTGEFKPSDSIGIRNSFENTKILFDKGYFTEMFQGLTYDQAIAEFANDKAGFIIGAQWTFGSVRNANPDADFSLFPIPYAQEGQSRAMAFISDGYAVNALAEERREAIEKLFDFFASQDYAKHLAKEITSPFIGITQQTSKKDVEFNKTYSEYFSPTYFQVYGWVDWGSISKRSMQDYLAGEDLEVVLKNLDSEIEKTVPK